MIRGKAIATYKSCLKIHWHLKFITQNIKIKNYENKNYPFGDDRVSFAFLFCTSASFGQNKMSVVGTWKLISGKATQGDSTFPYDDKTSNAIKIVTPTHFAVFSKNVSDDSLQHAGAGTIHVDDKDYIEEIKYSTFKDLVGKTAKFTYRIEGDKWYIKGGIENMITFEEVWQRVNK